MIFVRFFFSVTSCSGNFIVIVMENYKEIVENARAFVTSDRRRMSKDRLVEAYVQITRFHVLLHPRKRGDLHSIARRHVKRVTPLSITLRRTLLGLWLTF